MPKKADNEQRRVVKYLKGCQLQIGIIYYDDRSHVYIPINTNDGLQYYYNGLFKENI